jgi:hypothetical protein
LALSRGQQVVARARTLGGHQRIAAGDQTFARIFWVGDLGEVALIEQRQLQGLRREAVAGPAAPAGRDPFRKLCGANSEAARPQTEMLCFQKLAQTGLEAHLGRGAAD